MVVQSRVITVRIAESDDSNYIFKLESTRFDNEKCENQKSWVTRGIRNIDNNLEIR